MRVADAPPMTPTTASENQCALMSVRCQIMPTAISPPTIHHQVRFEGGRMRRDRDEQDARADRVPRRERAVVHAEERPEQAVREIVAPGGAGRRGSS